MFLVFLRVLCFIYKTINVRLNYNVKEVEMNSFPQLYAEVRKDLIRHSEG